MFIIKNVSIFASMQQEITLLQAFRKIFGSLYYRDKTPLTDREIVMCLPEQLIDEFTENIFEESKESGFTIIGEFLDDMPVKFTAFKTPTGILRIEHEITNNKITLEKL